MHRSTMHIGKVTSAYCNLRGCYRSISQRSAKVLALLGRPRRRLGANGVFVVATRPEVAFHLCIALSEVDRALRPVGPGRRGGSSILTNRRKAQHDIREPRNQQLEAA